MNLAATVLHNVSDDTFVRYDPETSRLHHAHTFQIVADNADQAADLIWMLTNVDDANHLASMRSDLSLYGPQVTAYRRRKNRSLSVGDVVVFHELTGDVQRPAGVRVVTSADWETIEVAGRELSRGPMWAAGSNETETSQSYLAHEVRYQQRRTERS